MLLKDTVINNAAITFFIFYTPTVKLGDNVLVIGWELFS